MLNIYIRKELNMRKGKMGAQTAHAAMKLFLEIMEHKGNSFILKSPQLVELKLWVDQGMPVKIFFVNGEAGIDEQLKMENPFSKIIDRGLTEFAGVHTLTCAAQGIFETAIQHEVIVPEASEIKAKQHLIFTKEKELSKETTCILAARAAILTLYNQMVVNSNNTEEMVLLLEPNTPMHSWLSGAFAKIGLGVKTKEELNAVAGQLKELNLGFGCVHHGENACLFTYPQDPAVIASVTSKLTLI